MLLYIIDGFNVIYKIPDLRDSADPRSELIAYIRKNRLTGSRNNRVIIVFDGKADMNLREQEFTVLFSDDRTADDIIKGKVSRMKNKKQAMVVSDDMEIRTTVKSEGANILSVADFVKIKKKTHQAKEDITKDISYSLQREITEELSKLWLKKE